MMFHWALTAGGGNCRVDTKLLALTVRGLSNDNLQPLSVSLVQLIRMVGWLVVLLGRMSVWKVRVVAVVAVVVVVVVVAGGETVRTLQPD